MNMVKIQSFVVILLSLLLMTACGPSREVLTSQAINEVMNEFQAVGISAAVVKNAKRQTILPDDFRDLARDFGLTLPEKFLK